MKAILYNQYGDPSVLKLKETDKPEFKDNEILIKLKASAVNSADIRLRKADPFLVRLVYGILKPKNPILGTVVSGIVENAGQNVTKFKIGDEVFGLSEHKMGGYAQYVSVSEDEPLALKPTNLTFDEAASIPFGGHSALYFLKKANPKPGQSILIYGASGAVGTSAIQLAKHFGLQVSAVCSTGNIDLVKSLGADHTIDYTKDNLQNLEQKFDILYETVDKSEVSKMAKLVKKDGVLILGAVIIKGMIQGLVAAKFKKIKMIAGVASVNSDDMNTLKELCESEILKPVIDKTYKLEDMAKAHSYADLGHKKGNLVITI